MVTVAAGAAATTEAGAAAAKAGAVAATRGLTLRLFLLATKAAVDDKAGAAAAAARGRASRCLALARSLPSRPPRISSVQSDVVREFV